MVKIKFLKDSEKVKAGEILETSKESAKRCIALGVAEYVKEETQIDCEMDIIDVVNEGIRQAIERDSQPKQSQHRDLEREAREANQKIFKAMVNKYLSDSLQKNEERLKADKFDTQSGKDACKEAIRIQKSEALLQDPELILKVHEVISTKHLKDDGAKLLCFLVLCTSYLKPVSLRKSIAFKGESSVGKDHLMRSCLECFPKEDWLFLTNATQSTMEDDIARHRMIAYSEVNHGRVDKGANAHLIETLKQMTEGGTSSLKKDIRTGFKTTLHSVQEQKTVLYSSTETESDEELATRFIVASVEAPQEKIKRVNKNTKNWFKGERELSDYNEALLDAIASLESREVYLPYLDKLPENFEDTQDARSMRDLKRFFSLVCAVAWLYQAQRTINDKGVILSEPQDLIIALIISQPFFNMTYSGFEDIRVEKFIIAMNEYLALHGGDTFPRDEIQRELGYKSVNTIKNLSKRCQDLSIIRYDGLISNQVMYKRCQKGVKRVLIGVNWKTLFNDLKGVKGVNFPENVMSLLEKLGELCENSGIDSTSEKNDTPNLTPSDQKEDPKPKSDTTNKQTVLKDLTEIDKEGVCKYCGNKRRLVLKDSQEERCYVCSLETGWIKEDA